LELKEEMLKYKGQSGDIDAFYVRPSQGKHPGIVVIHEIWGLNDHIKDVSRRFASEGFAVIAPHLFSSKYVPEGMTAENITEVMRFFMTLPAEKQRDLDFVKGELAKLPEEKRKIVGSLMGSIFNLPRDKLLLDLTGAVDFLEQRAEVVKGKIGSVGFCFGGGMSGRLACTGKTAGSVIFYGENPEPIESVRNIRGAVLGIYGGMDKRINAGLPDLIKAMVEYEKDFEMKLYPGCPHAFFNDTNPSVYRAEAAKDAYSRVLKFYERTLKQ
jgi:carboxymethylenebutenolidase